MIPSPLKYHGGKSYLAQRLVAMMPLHLHYVEPYFGGGSVLLAKDPEGVSEVVNDLNGDLINFWSILQEPGYFEGFARAVAAIPFSEAEFNNACNISIEAGSLERAIAFFIRCRQSLAGRMKDFASLSRNRVRRGMNEQASAWWTGVEGLPLVHDRMKRVVILCRPAVDVIKQQDGPNTICYIDPPYLHETRVTTGEYKHEMTANDHIQLLDTLCGVTGKFLLSGYDHEIYRAYELSQGWHRTVFDLPNNAAGGDTKKRMQEVVWTNYEVAK